MAEYPIHPYIIHCLEPLLANAAAPVVLALDGRCGSGKTTMAAALAEQFPDSIFARLRDEVLAPARAGKPVLYRAYSCREGAYLPVQQLAAQPLVILEGSYSHHPLLAPYEDFRVFMTCSDAEQTRRLQAREGDRYPDFAARWVPLEEAYFTQHNIEDAADFVMDTTTD